MSLHTDHRALLAVALGSFLVLSTVVAVLPAIEATETEPGAGVAELSAAAKRGREIYIREGCTVCHTQFVRELPVDAAWGRGSVAGDYALEAPPLLGTQRTGPDLANVGRRQSGDTWNLIHLYNPRAVVATSVMPGYPWYFRETSTPADDDIVVPVPERFHAPGTRIVATREAIDLVRYLQSLAQPALER